MEQRSSYDIIAGASEVANSAFEVKRKVEKITFSTDPSLRGDLAFLCANAVRVSHLNKAFDPEIASLSDNPLLDAFMLLSQLEGEVDSDELTLNLSGSMLDMVNVLYTQLIDDHRLAQPSTVKSRMIRFEKLNIDYQRAGGLESPVFTEYMRQKEASQ